MPLSTHSWFYLSILRFASLIASQVQLNPNDFLIPISIRSPYLNAWSRGNSAMNTTESFWTANILILSKGRAWIGHIRVDGQTFQWVGDAPINSTNFTGVQVTPTKTTFFSQAGPMNITATFLSPIEPQDPVKQSLPFSYLSFEAVSTDGAEHSVNVYSDIYGGWVSTNGSSIINWNTTQNAGSTFHTISLQTPRPYTELDDQAEDVTVYYAAPSSPGLTSDIGSNGASPRIVFDNQGFLTNSAGEGSGTIANPFPVFGHAVDLGNITHTASPIVWALGVVRNPCIQYTTPDNQIQNRSPYFASQGDTIDEVIDSVLNDFTSASQRADALDKKILDAASSITSNPAYAGLVSFAIRQAWGASELTLSLGNDGTWNKSDVKMFMKDVGSSRRVNAVETLYAALPAFLYVNATYAGYLLAPLLEYQDSLLYGQPYSARDLGQAYPIASGNNAVHPQGVEQSGNMLIMVLAYTRIAGDGTLIDRHYNLLKEWADYLVSNTLTPTDQETADLERQANLTNLAIKGIIGIKAMAEISQVLNLANDSVHYDSIATNYANQWQSMALSKDQTHLVADYGDDGSWTLAYNLYADRLLQTQLVSDSVYQLLTEYYKGLTSSSVATLFGLPIDSTITTASANSAWTMFTAAVTTNPAVRDILINAIWAHASNSNNSSPFPVQYSLENGVVNGLSSPAQGAMLAPLALTVPNITITVPAASNNSDGGGGNVTPNKSIIGPIVGGVIGGLALIISIILCIFFWRRRSTSRFLTPGSYENYEPKVFDITSTALLDAEHGPYNGHGSSTQVDDAGQRIMSFSPGAPADQCLIVVPSSKAMEAISRNNAQAAALNRAQYTDPAGVSSTSFSGNSDREERDATTDLPAAADVRELRDEIENLRRVVLGIRVERVDAPPTYVG
ncbi:hypothetical protein C8Q75DRAFT_840168 [Abortiporus biennis]|nr:hypothetical protein C8Q75DRAFT_840168 [Abortiporus biennis]